RGAGGAGVPVGVGVGIGAGQGAVPVGPRALHEAGGLLVEVDGGEAAGDVHAPAPVAVGEAQLLLVHPRVVPVAPIAAGGEGDGKIFVAAPEAQAPVIVDRKSTRLNSSHV